jgi:hypothetical protein
VGRPARAAPGPARKLRTRPGRRLVTTPLDRAVKPQPFTARLRRAGLILGGALLVLLLIATPPLKSLRRLISLRRGRGGAGERVTAAYEVLCDEAADVGLGRRPFETPREYQRRLVAFAPECGAELERLTDLTVRANYALNGIGPKEGAEAVALSQTAAGAIHGVRRIRRVLGWYRIGSWDPGATAGSGRPSRPLTPSFASRVASRSTRTNWSRSRRNSATSPGPAW